MNLLNLHIDMSTENWLKYNELMGAENPLPFYLNFDAVSKPETDPTLIGEYVILVFYREYIVISL